GFGGGSVVLGHCLPPAIPPLPASPMPCCGYRNLFVTEGSGLDRPSAAEVSRALAAGCCALALGRVSRTIAPPSGFWLMWVVPWWLAATARTMRSPSPGLCGDGCSS